MSRPILFGLVALAALAAAGLACDGSTSDRKERFAEIQAMHEDKAFELNRVRQAIHDENMRRWRETDRRRLLYAHRFVGQIEPGVGCDVCPDECAIIDYRPLAAEALMDRWRQTAIEYHDPADEDARWNAWFEILRLRCIAEGQPAPFFYDVLIQLAKPSEHPSVRYAAALHLTQYKHLAEGRAALEGLAAGEGKIEDMARYDLEIWAMNEVAPSF